MLTIKKFLGVAFFQFVVIGVILFSAPLVRAQEYSCGTYSAGDYSTADCDGTPSQNNLSGTGRSNVALWLLSFGFIGLAVLLFTINALYRKQKNQNKK